MTKKIRNNDVFWVLICFFKIAFTHIGWHFVTGTLGIESQQPYRFSFADLRTYGLTDLWTTKMNLGWLLCPQDSCAIWVESMRGASPQVDGREWDPLFSNNNFRNLGVWADSSTACCNGKLQYLLHLVIQVVGCHWYCDVLCMVLHKVSSGVSAVIGAVSSLILWVSWSYCRVISCFGKLVTQVPTASPVICF